MYYNTRPKSAPKGVIVVCFHINVQHHFVRKQVENGEVMFEYCSTEDMVVDVLTKALSKEQHNKLMTMFGLKTS
jgi:hypothetical protein